MLYRSTLLALACCCTVPGQSRGQSLDGLRAFLSEVFFLGTRDSSVAGDLQVEVGLSAEEAQTLRNVAAELHAKASVFSRDLRRAIWERRMAVTAGDEVSVSESQLVDEGNRQWA